jgi:putative NIF3 family GTP cyclohydrolase 1 type 2
MRKSEVIAHIKQFCGGIAFDTGKPIDERTTRDQITYGKDKVEQACTGIVTCIWPTADIIREAQHRGANLIITHEALFWNHGDHEDTLKGNRIFAAKKELLDTWGGTVWRCHDYIHSKVPIEADGSLADGIFYGFAWKVGWLDYRTGDTSQALDFEMPEVSGRELADHLVASLGLEGTRLIGDAEARVKRVHIPMHVMGDAASDTHEIMYADSEGVDALVTMEFIDFTTSEYIRDAAQLGQGKCAITVGHFNLEEPGMEYMVRWLPCALGTDEIPLAFVPMKDTYSYIVRKEA